MSIPLLSLRREWWCPHCTVTSVTEQAGMHVEFHHCRGMAGLWAPMFQRGERGHLVAVEREDYVGRDKVTTDANGRPVMRLERWVDGQQRDVTVFAPCGQARIGLDSVAEQIPTAVRRKGADAMRLHVVRALRSRLNTKKDV